MEYSSTSTKPPYSLPIYDAQKKLSPPGWKKSLITSILSAGNSRCIIAGDLADWFGHEPPSLRGA